MARPPRIPPTPSGGLVQSVLVVKQTTIANANFTVEKNDEGGFRLHFDLILGSVAERFTFPFDANGFERFKNTLIAAGSGVEIAGPGSLHSIGKEPLQ